MAKNKEQKEIEDSIKWFSKFPLKKRLQISEIQRQSILMLRRLKPKKHG